MQKLGCFRGLGVCYDVSVRLSVRLSVTEVHWVAVHAGKSGGVISRYASHC